jgi:CheY-like chemotaxis protein
MARRILIIDDEENARLVTRRTLEAAGYEVGEAADGERGLEAFGDGTGWGVVLLDERMPGMDGLETLRHIRARRSAARVIVSTAYASIELAVEAMKLGAYDFVRKPLTPELLRNAVAAALSRPPDASGRGRVDSVARETALAPHFHNIQTVTMNGFTIIESEGGPRVSGERRFTVRSPGGDEHEVSVSIEDEAVGYVERMTRRRLPAVSSFWTIQAQHALSEYLWREGRVPPTRRLSVEDVDRDELPVAARW